MSPAASSYFGACWNSDSIRPGTRRGTGDWQSGNGPVGRPSGGGWSTAILMQKTYKTRTLRISRGSIKSTTPPDAGRAADVQPSWCAAKGREGGAERRIPRGPGRWKVVSLLCWTKNVCRWAGVQTPPPRLQPAAPPLPLDGPERDQPDGGHEGAPTLPPPSQKLTATQQQEFPQVQVQAQVLVPGRFPEQACTPSGIPAAQPALSPYLTLTLASRLFLFILDTFCALL